MLDEEETSYIGNVERPLVVHNGQELYIDLRKQGASRKEREWFFAAIMAGMEDAQTLTTLKDLRPIIEEAEARGAGTLIVHHSGSCHIQPNHLVPDVWPDEA